MAHRDILNAVATILLIRRKTNDALNAIACLDGIIPRRVEAELSALGVTACICHKVKRVTPNAVATIRERNACSIPTGSGNIANDTCTSDS